MGLRRSNQVILRLSDTELAELVTLVPDSIDATSGGTKYGFWQKYFLGLMRQDIEERKRRLQEIQTAGRPPFAGQCAFCNAPIPAEQDNCEACGKTYLEQHNANP